MAREFLEFNVTVLSVQLQIVCYHARDLPKIEPFWAKLVDIPQFSSKVTTIVVVDDATLQIRIVMHSTDSLLHIFNPVYRSFDQKLTPISLRRPPLVEW
jgi:hypothetical protein